MKLGVSTYTWPWAIGIDGYLPKKPIGITDVLRKAKNLDVKLVQLADKPHLHKLSDSEISEIKSTADSLGITLEVGTRGIEKGHLLKYLDIAKKLKSKIVRTVVPGFSKDELSQVKQIIPFYEKDGVIIALENHDEHGAEDMIDFIENIGSANIGVCLDTLNSLRALESPKTTIEKLAPYAASLHIKDFDIFRMDHKLGFIIEGRPAGKGRLDIEWIIDCVEENKPPPNVILELWTPYSEKVENTIKKEDQWAAESIKYLRQILN